MTVPSAWESREITDGKLLVLYQPDPVRRRSLWSKGASGRTTTIMAAPAKVISQMLKKPRQLCAVQPSSGQ